MNYIRRVVHRLSTPLFLGLTLAIFSPLVAQAAIVFDYIGQGSQGFGNPYLTATSTAQISVSPGATLYYSWCFDLTGSTAGLITGVTADVPNLSGNVDNGFSDGPLVVGSNCGTATSSLVYAINQGQEYYPYIYRNGAGVATTTFTSFQIGSTPIVGIRKTEITSIVPITGQVEALNTPFDIEADGWVTASDTPHDLFVNFTVTGQDAIQVGFTPSLVSADPIFSTKVDVILDGNGAQGWTVSTSSIPIGVVGNYAITAQLQYQNSILGFNSFFGLFGFGNTTLATKYGTFIVGTSTTLGRILTGLREVHATSTEATLRSCLPVPGYFDISTCVWTLFVPDDNEINQDVQSLKNGIANRWPWGYFTRLVSIFTSSSTSTLPSLVVPIQIGPNSTTTFAFDEQDMIVTGAATLDAIRDPMYGKSLRDVTEPFLQLFIGLSVLIIIFFDLIGMGQDAMARGRGEGSGSSNRDPSAYREWLYEHRK